MVDCLLEFFGGVVGFGDAGLDHDGGVATLVVLGFVSDGTDYITGVESDGSTEGCEGGNKYRNDDFNEFDFVHKSIFLAGNSIALTMEKVFLVADLAVNIPPKGIMFFEICSILPSSYSRLALDLLSLFTRSGNVLFYIKAPDLSFKIRCKDTSKVRYVFLRR